MTSDKKQAEWESLAATWIKKCDEGDPNWEGILDRYMLKVLGPVEGLRIVDLACSEGTPVRSPGAG